MENKPTLLDIRNVEVHFQNGKQVIHAVQGVSLAINLGVHLGFLPLLGVLGER